MILNSTTTCTGTDASGTICTTLYAADPSSTVATANGFTYGEVVISMFQFLTLLVLLSMAYHQKFRKIKIKNS
jgi:hypothetical protein